VKYLEENAEDVGSSNAALIKAYMIAEEEARCRSDKMENTANIVNVMTQKDEKSRLENDPLLCFALSAATTLRPSGSSGGGRRAEWDEPIGPRVVIKFGNVYNDTEILRTATMMQEAYGQVIKLYGNPIFAMKFNNCGEYTVPFKVKNEVEGTLMLTKREKGFTDLLYNPPILLPRGSTREEDGAVTPPLSNEEINYIPDVTADRREKGNTRETNTCQDTESVSDPMSIPPSSISKAISEADLEAAKTVSELGQQRRSNRQRRATNKYGSDDEHLPLARRALPTRRKKAKEDARVMPQQPEKSTEDRLEDERDNCFTDTETKESDKRTNISQDNATNDTHKENDTVETITIKRNTISKVTLCKCAFRSCEGFEKNVPVIPCSRCGNLVHRTDRCSALTACIEESTCEDVVCTDCSKYTKYN
jgi:hypothetical protein